MDALSYVFVCGHTSALCKDVMEVASFFILYKRVLKIWKFVTIEEKCFKILIVEDEEISRNLYRMWLKNYDLSFCDSEKSMYDKLSDKIFGLIIMDIGLPSSKDGLSLIKELKVNKDFLKIPTVVLHLMIRMIKKPLF